MVAMGDVADHSNFAAPARLRASDADRDRVAQILGEALADGRLTAEEHSERLAALYRAKTLGELQPLVADLGRSSTLSELEELPGSATGSENIVAVFSSARRNGRWLVEPRTNTTTLFGDISLDLREAVLSQREVVIQCVLIFGSLKLTVPPGVRVVNQTTPIFGEVNVKKMDSTVSINAPTIRLQGTVIFGSIKVRTRTLREKKFPWFH